MPLQRSATGDRTPLRVQRDTWLVLVSLVLLTALAWLYLLDLARDMQAMRAMPAMAAQPWDLAAALFAFAMWSVMMAAMMLPSAAPMVLLAARTPGGSHARTALFALGYLAVWTVFSAGATALQGGLQALRLLTDSGLVHQDAAGVVLIAAGVYQWTPLKGRCLEHCRSPLSFLLHHWRPGYAGALRVGLAHGAYCLGCCWVLMLLLFVSGVMNLLWAAGLAVLVLLEKVLPGGPWLARAVGVGLMLWGAALLGGQV